jgi:SAM-dependent methyltransferase
MGCGAGPNLIWLAQKGVRVSGIDIAPTALALARKNLKKAGGEKRVDDLVEGSVAAVPFEDGRFDGIIESCVFQHLTRDDRRAAFGEVRRLLKPGGIFVGYMLSDAHTTFQKRSSEQLPDDPGTLMLKDGGSKVYLTNIGLSHFFRREEFAEYLAGFTEVDPCSTVYELPRREARRRGYETYVQGMWTVYAVK